MLEDGRLLYVWDDALAGLAELGQATVSRASHVEPAPAGGWTADLSPAGGPMLGPFRLRADALGAELAWLHENMHHLTTGACQL